MESAWLDDNPGARFIRKLKRRRVDSLLENKKLLMELRYDWEALQSYRKCFKEVWEEREIDLFELVMSASQTSRTPSPPKEKKKHSPSVHWRAARTLAGSCGLLLRTGYPPTCSSC